MTKPNTTTIPVPRDVAMTLAFVKDGLSQRTIGRSPELTGEAQGLTRQRVNDIIRRTCRLIFIWRIRNGDAFTREVCGLTQDELAAICIEYEKQLRRRESDPRLQRGGAIQK
jgi:hypothetical protein